MAAIYVYFVFQFPHDNLHVDPYIFTKPSEQICFQNNFVWSILILSRIGKFLHDKLNINLDIVIQSQNRCIVFRILHILLLYVRFLSLCFRHVIDTVICPRLSACPHSYDVHSVCVGGMGGIVLVLLFPPYANCLFQFQCYKNIKQTYKTKFISSN